MTTRIDSGEVYEPCTDSWEGEQHHDCGGYGRPEENIKDCSCTCHLGVEVLVKDEYVKNVEGSN